jgi:hypothetical protein
LVEAPHYRLAGAAMNLVLRVEFVVYAFERCPFDVQAGVTEVDRDRL